MLVAVALAMAVLAFVMFQRNEVTTPPAAPIPSAYDTGAGLGEIGAQCGGDLRLPCKPGLSCVIMDKTSATGICGKLTEGIPGKIEPLSASAPVSATPTEANIVNFRKD